MNDTTPAPIGADALRLAELLELAPEDGVEPQTAEDAAAELRRQHTRIAELEAQLEAIGAGGVSGPLMGCASIAASAGSEPVAPSGWREAIGEIRKCEWKSIETAPKDGTRILLHPAVEVHDAWSKGYWSEQHECWIVGGSASGVTHTYWLPLPPTPPTTSAGSRKGE